MKEKEMMVGKEEVKLEQMMKGKEQVMEEMMVKGEKEHQMKGERMKNEMMVEHGNVKWTKWRGGTD